MNLAHQSQNPYGLEYDQIFIPSQRFVIRTLKSNDCAHWLKVRHRDYHYLQNKEPIWDMDSLTYQGFDRLLHDLQSAFLLGNYYSFAIFHNQTDELIGGVELSNVLFWPKQSATIGYWISERYAGQGYATELAKTMASWAFKSLNLVKIESATLVSNMASQRVLIKAGFIKEGLSQSYGEINGLYQDHILWGLVKQ